MAFTIDEAFLPATPTSHPMTDEEFVDFCSEHPDLFFEMTAEGEIVVMPPRFTLTGIRNMEISGQLNRWALQDRRGGVPVIPQEALSFPTVQGVHRTLRGFPGAISRS